MSVRSISIIWPIIRKLPIYRLLPQQIRFCDKKAITMEGMNIFYRVSKKNWVLPNWSFADPSGSWWEILVTFSANLVEPVKSRAVGLVHVRIMLINHFYLCGFWYHELSWLLKISVMIRICQTANKSIEIDNSKHDSIGFATKITSISHQPPAGSANAQFDKTQFFLRHPVSNI